MATVNASGNPTLLDQIKRTDPNGQIASIVEALTERNPILMDATAMEGNLPTGHRLTIRDGLPAVSWRRYNEGITPSKSTTIQVDETCGMLEGRSVVDCALAKLNGNEAAFRASEDQAYLQALNNEMADAMMYASTSTDPEKIHGFTPRYDSLSGGNSDNIIDSTLADSSTVNRRSIWFVTWGPDTAYMIYPKGSQAGVTVEDLGKEYVQDSDGTSNKEFLAWRTHYKWDAGLCIKDWRYHARIANIDVTQATPSAADEIIYDMVDAYNRIYDLNSGRTVIYMSRAVLTLLDQAILGKSNMYFTPVDWHGRQINSFRGIPIVTLDALNYDEAAVS